MNTKNRLRQRWTTANGISELLGLGATFIIIESLVSKIDTQSATGILLAFALRWQASPCSCTCYTIDGREVLSWKRRENQ
jgi:hypothetical protein